MNDGAIRLIAFAAANRRWRLGAPHRLVAPWRVLSVGRSSAGVKPGPAAE